MAIKYDGGIATFTWRDATGEPSSTTVYAIDPGSATDWATLETAVLGVRDAMEAFQVGGTNRVKYTLGEVNQGTNPDAPASDNASQRELKIKVTAADDLGNTQTFTIPMADPTVVSFVPGAGDFIDLDDGTGNWTALQAALVNANIQSIYGRPLTTILKARLIGVRN